MPLRAVDGAFPRLACPRIQFAGLAVYFAGPLVSQGKGVDRHLFALLCMAKKRAEHSGAGDDPVLPIPAMFEDEAWLTLNHVILSTR